MKPPLERHEWPQWLQRNRLPWRFIAGRVEDVQDFVRIYSVVYGHCYHYSTAKHVETIKTPWPIFFIESADGDDVAKFLADQVVAAAIRSGNKVLPVRREVLFGAPFPMEVQLMASTWIELARKEERARRRATATPKVKHVQIPITTFA